MSLCFVILISFKTPVHVVQAEPLASLHKDKVNCLSPQLQGT